MFPVATCYRLKIIGNKTHTKVWAVDYHFLIHPSLSPECQYIRLITFFCAFHTKNFISFLYFSASFVCVSLKVCRYTYAILIFFIPTVVIPCSPKRRPFGISLFLQGYPLLVYTYGKRITTAACIVEVLIWWRRRLSRWVDRQKVAGAPYWLKYARRRAHAHKYTNFIMRNGYFSVDLRQKRARKISKTKTIRYQILLRHK